MFAPVRRLRPVALGLALLLASAPSGAQPTEAELAAARQIFNDGKDLEKANDWAGALAKFKKVAEVKTTPQVRYHMALCEENLGHAVAALNGYEAAVGLAKQPGTNGADVLENAPPRIEALRKKIAKLHLVVNGKVISSRVLLDKQPIASALFNTDIPIDPGQHKVEVETDGQVVQRRSVSLAEQETGTVEFTIDDKEPAVEPTTSPTAPPPPPPGPSRTPVWVAGGVGVAGLVATGVFAVLRQVAITRLQDDCPTQTNCTPADKPIQNDASNYSYAADISIAVAGAGVITAVVLYVVTTPSKKNAPPPVSAAPGGLVVRF